MEKGKWGAHRYKNQKEGYGTVWEQGKYTTKYSQLCLYDSHGMIKLKSFRLQLLAWLINNWGFPTYWDVRGPKKMSSRREEKGTTEDEMVGWHHRLDGHEFEWTLGVGDGQGGLACYGPWSWRVGHDWETELNWTERKGHPPIFSTRAPQNSHRLHFLQKGKAPQLRDEKLPGNAADSMVALQASRHHRPHCSSAPCWKSRGGPWGAALPSHLIYCPALPIHVSRKWIETSFTQDSSWVRALKSPANLTENFQVLVIFNTLV